MSRRVFGSALVLLLAPLVPAQDPEPRLVEEAWFVISMAGAKAGHSMRRIELVEQDGQTLQRMVETSRMRMGRFGQEVEIVGRTEYLERANGSLISSSTVADVSRRESRTNVIFRDGRAHIESEVAGRTTELEKEIPPDSIGPVRAAEMIRERLDEPGAEFVFTTWSADMSDFIDVVVEIVGPETIEIDGEERELVRVEFELEGIAIRATNWFDEDGKEMRALMRAAGLEIRSDRATEQEALAASSGDDASAPDVFTPTMVVEEFFVPQPRSALRAVVEVKARDGELRTPIPASDHQRVVRTNEDGSMLLELSAAQPPAGTGGERPLADPPADLAASLGVSSMIQCDDERIVATAREVVAGEPDAWRSAQALERWVATHLTEKSMDVGFASAIEVFEDRAGDCSEHAVLLCALGRAAGIPTRVAMGMLYIGGSWAGHAWNEVWIDGRWYPLDATIGLGYADALRITLSTMTLDDQASASEFAGLVANIGSLDVQVHEVDIGRRVRPAASYGRVEDGRYVDRSFGISFDVPEGAEAEIASPADGLGFELVEIENIPTDGSDLRIDVRAYDVDANGGWPDFLGELSGTEATVDGRPALVVDNGSTRRILVRSGGTVFELVCRGFEGDNEALADAWLRSVDFDV